MTTTDRTTATDAEFVARFAPFDPALTAPVGLSTREQLAEELVQHRARSRHYCNCGWEGDDIAFHLFDVLTPLVEQIATERAASELEAAADGVPRFSPAVIAKWLRDRSAALRSQSNTDSKGDQP